MECIARNQRNLRASHADLRKSGRCTKIVHQLSKISCQMEFHLAKPKIKRLFSIAQRVQGSFWILQQLRPSKTQLCYFTTNMAGNWPHPNFPARWIFKTPPSTPPPLSLTVSFAPTRSRVQNSTGNQKKWRSFKWPRWSFWRLNCCHGEQWGRRMYSDIGLTKHFWPLVVLLYKLVKPAICLANLVQKQTPQTHDAWFTPSSSQQSQLITSSFSGSIEWEERYQPRVSH